MSRIFDALQRSMTEGDGLEFPFNPSSISEMAPATEVEANDIAPSDLARFQSLTISTLPSSRLVSLTDQASLAAEKFRFLGVRLRQLCQIRSLKKLLITSTVPEEGKTMVSANLAITLAQRRPQKVLLLEGDLRRPALTERFGLSAMSGLSDWLQDGKGTIPNICKLERAGCWFLPAGAPPANPLELIQSERMTELMGHLTDWFDWIVIDSPPIAPLADTSVWMRSVDAVLMVAREGVTKKRQLKRALQELDQSRLLGVVLNSSSNTDHANYYQRYGPMQVKSIDATFRTREQDDQA